MFIPFFNLPNHKSFFSPVHVFNSCINEFLSLMCSTGGNVIQINSPHPTVQLSAVMQRPLAAYVKVLIKTQPIPNKIHKDLINSC